MCEGGSDAIASDGTSQIPVTCVQSQGIVSEVSGGCLRNKRKYLDYCYLPTKVVLQVLLLVVCIDTSRTDR